MSQDCSFEKLGYTVLTCWDPLGNQNDKPRTGSICELLQRANNITYMVKCTSRGWSTVKKQYPNSNTGLSRLVRHKRSIWDDIGDFFDRAMHTIGCFFIGCKYRPRDTTPPSMRGVCPDDIIAFADKFQEYTKVTWTENKAFDETDGYVETKLTRGRKPGHYFQDETNIAYIAKDKAGNLNSCSFNVNVKVIRCPRIPHVHDGYYHCHPSSDDTVYGSVCRFGCYGGHSLTGGKSEVTCTKSGKWSGALPRCQKHTCPVLKSTDLLLQITCTNGNEFRSICTYSCPYGYEIKSGISRVRVCTQGGWWSGSVPTCIDIDPPQIAMCPGTVYGYAERNSLNGSVVWREPYATDNHDQTITITKTGSVAPNRKIQAGIYQMTYNAVDSTGNKAVPCVIKVVMKVIKCPEIYPTPFQSITCPSGTKYGSICNISCEVGSSLNGTDNVVCEKEEEKQFGYWTWEDKRSFCQDLNRCGKTPNPPKNGALACDIWLGGQFCQMLCKDGYDVSPGTPFEEMLTCDQQSGKWFPPNFLPLPDCSKSLMAKSGESRMGVFYYFEGDCSSAETVQNIKTQFIKTLNSLTYKEACSIHTDKCNVKNVQVICGETSHKRSVGMRIEFDITFELSNTSNETFKQAQQNFYESLRQNQMDGKLDNLINTAGQMVAQRIQHIKIILDCPENTVESLRTFSCVECSPGTFYNNESLTCPQCQRGYYQNQSRQDFCIPCPGNKTTKSIGSKSVTNCTDACEPGYWSADGTPVCSLCPIGTFSNSFGLTNCTQCKHSRSTEIEGAVNESFCQEFDLWLTDRTSIAYTQFHTQMSYNVFLTSLWFQKDNSSDIFIISIKNARNESEVEIRINANISLSTKRNSDIHAHWEQNGWHYLILSINDTELELYIDNELIIATDSEIQLENNNTYEFYLQGKAKVSQLNIWSTNSTNLKAALSDVMTDKKLCSLKITGDILSWRTFENINLENTFKNIPSSCDDFDSCKLEPCKHGICKDTLDGFECKCHAGFYGETCDWNTDDCIGNACENNSTCEDGILNYTCNCSSGFKGILCEIAMVNGGWGSWNSWSPCSETCGNGTQKRTRVCNDPEPDNGGLECPDNSTEFKTCIMDDCRVCGNLTVTDHVILTCENLSEDINCTIACEKGYGFDHTIKPFYLCGESTYFFWDFKTSDNPDGKLPQCIEEKDSEKMTFIYSASYVDLVCDSDEKAKDSKDIILKKINVQSAQIECILNGTCTLEHAHITKCIDRSKREIRNKTAGFELKFGCNSGIYSSEECYYILKDALGMLLVQTNSNNFSIEIHGNTYHLSMSSVRLATDLVCPTGSVSMDIHCVECSYGRYYRDDECIKCDFGTYQDETGKSFCKKCPEGTTTPGRESRSVLDCSLFLKDNTKERLIVVFGVLFTVFALVFLLMIAIAIKKRLTNEYDVGKPVYSEMEMHQKYSKTDEHN